MLEEHEWPHIAAEGWKGVQAVKDFRTAAKKGLTEISQERMFELRWAGLLDAYHELTGYRETNPNAIWHHRVAIYGDPCQACGKPLRTPRASWCAACGHSSAPARSGSAEGADA